MSLLNDLKGISTAPENRFELVHGFAGSGKTTFIGTYPKPLLLVEIGADGGSAVLKNYSDKEVQRIAIPSDDNIIKNVLDLLNEIDKNGKEFATIVFDTYSAIQDICVSELEKEKGKKLSQQEWGQVGGYMELIKNKIADLSSRPDRNTIFIAVLHSKIVQGTDRMDGTEYSITYPKLTRNNADKLSEKARSIIFMTRKNYIDDDGEIKVGYYSYIGAMPTILTKFRTVDKKIESGFFIKDCTFEKLNALRNGTKTKEELAATNIIEPKNTDIDEDTSPFAEE
ncbi:MAG: AAA family ATPase [Desulfuromonadaceae bacterium]|nr:AAA family ATPase [Desulfuromonadaceae bacterium]